MNTLRIVRDGKTVAEKPLAEEEGLIRLPPCPGEEKLAVESAAARGLDFAGVDILMGRNDEERYVCEVNSNPQLQSTIDCCGVNPATNIMWHIRSKLIGAAGAAE